MIKLLLIWCSVLSAGVLGGSYFLHQTLHEAPAPARRLAPPLSLPARINIHPAMSLYARVEPETTGSFVKWHADPPIEVIQTGPKSCLVMGAKPGSYKLYAWTSLDGIPSDVAVATVIVAGPVTSAASTEPQPPAKPPRPKPVAERLWLIVVADKTKDKGKQVIGDTAFWKELEKKGHKWAVVDISEKKILADNHYDTLVEEAGGPPALLILDRDSDPPNQPLRNIPLPEDTKAIAELIKTLTGK